VNLKPSITLAFILLIFVSQAVIYPQNRQVFPRIEPDEKALYFHNLGKKPGGHTWMELAEIALWASGNTAASNLERLRTAVTAFNNLPDIPSSEKEKAEFILTFLHRNILRTYSIYQTRVDTALTSGTFNCVSSAVLYMIFCEAAGIKTSGVITKDHAFIIVHIDGQDIDVETTNRFGFDPGNRREFHDQFGRLTGFSYVPAQNYRDRQTINKIELISLIFKNRIADNERRNNFSDPVPLVIDRFFLLLGEALNSSGVYSSESLFADPHKELLDRLINYGASLLRANREEDSLRWAEIASSRYPDPDINRWQEYTFTAVHNRITRFIRDRRIEDAKNFLETNKSLLSESNYDHIYNLIRINMAVEYHNRFAAEWNRRNYDEAERILNEGLAEFPDNRQLLNNRETVNRHRAQRQ